MKRFLIGAILAIALTGCSSDNTSDERGTVSGPEPRATAGGSWTPGQPIDHEKLGTIGIVASDSRPSECNPIQWPTAYLGAVAYDVSANTVSTYVLFTDETVCEVLSAWPELHVSIETTSYYNGDYLTLYTNTVDTCFDVYFDSGYWIVTLVMPLSSTGNCSLGGIFFDGSDSGTTITLRNVKIHYGLEMAEGSCCTSYGSVAWSPSTMNVYP